MRRILSDIDRGIVVEHVNMTVSQFLDKWLMDYARAKPPRPELKEKPVIDEEQMTRRLQGCREHRYHIKVVSERLGHSRVGFTLDSYSHLLPSQQEEAARRIDATLRSAVGDD